MHGKSFTFNLHITRDAMNCNFCHLASEVFSEQYVSGGQVSVHVAFVGQVVHTKRNLTTEPHKHVGEVFRLGL